MIFQLAYLQYLIFKINSAYQSHRSLVLKTKISSRPDYMNLPETLGVFQNLLDFYFILLFFLLGSQTWFRKKAISSSGSLLTFCSFSFNVLGRWEVQRGQSETISSCNYSARGLVFNLCLHLCCGPCMIVPAHRAPTAFRGLQGCAHSRHSCRLDSEEPVSLHLQRVTTCGEDWVQRGPKLEFLSVHQITCLVIPDLKCVSCQCTKATKECLSFYSQDQLWFLVFHGLGQGSPSPHILISFV